MPEPAPATEAHAPESNFTIGLDHRPQLRPTHSLIASLPYCVCCLCGYDHATPDCPPRAALHISSHICQLHSTPDDPTDEPDPTSQALLSEQDWSALHWDIWQEDYDPEATTMPMDPPHILSRPHANAQ